MMGMNLRWPCRGLAVLSIVCLAVPARAQEPVYWDVIGKIEEEGFQRSQVMNLVGYMTDVLGPRVTSSHGMRRAQLWAKATMDSLGLTNTAIESFGEHGVGWDNEYTSLHMLEPDYQPLIGYPFAFTPGTEGKLVSQAQIAIIRSREDFERYRGKLQGAIALISPPGPAGPRFEQDATRLSQEELNALAGATVASRFGIDDVAYEWDTTVNFFRPVGSPSPSAVDLPPGEILRFLKGEGVGAVLYGAPGGSGTVLVGARPGSRLHRSYDEAMAVPPMVALASEHYNRIFRILKRGIPVTLEIEVRNSLDNSDTQGYNVLGEIRGSDLADELVMAGGHFDSWHTGTGATDNAAGVAVALEAVRIIRAIGVQPRRTIRVALWSYEEGGKVGSIRYVAKHFGSPEQGKTAEYDRFSVYFNMDSGTGQFRGVHLQGNERVRPILSAWMEPFRHLGMNTLTSNDAYGTDHIAFDMAGLPGFDFIQDPIDYDARTHHTNMDVYDKLIPEDLRKNAVILASFLYHAAMRDEKMPRQEHP